MWVAHSGGLPQSLSANVPFGPISLYHKLAQFNADPQRNAISVQNQSASQVQLLCQDGVNGNIFTIMLAPAPAAGQGGGGFWYSQTFKGQIAIWSANTTDAVAAWVD